MTDVLCIGIAVLDVLVHGMEGQVFAAEMLQAQSISMSSGGDASNEAVMISRLGHSVKLMCGLGRDAAGNFVTQRLRGSGVDTSLIVYDDGFKTPINVLLVNREAERVFVSEGMSGAEFFAPDIGAIRNVRLVSMASLFRHPFLDPVTILEVAKAAKRAGAVLCVDIKITPEDVGLEDIKEALPYIDYLFPNEKEAAFFTGKMEPDDIADALLDKGVGCVVMKLGQRGCLAKSKEARVQQCAFKVNVLDTTGAGDSFASGFITALLDGKELAECCKFACAAAALSVQSLGATTHETRKEEVLELINATEQEK